MLIILDKLYTIVYNNHITYQTKGAKMDTQTITKTALSNMQNNARNKIAEVEPGMWAIVAETIIPNGKDRNFWAQITPNTYPSSEAACVAESHTGSCYNKITIQCG